MKQKYQVIMEIGGGYYSDNICFAVSEELATIEAIKYMTERYPEFDWTKEKDYITDKTNTYYPRRTWYNIKAIEVKEN